MRAPPGRSSGYARPAWSRSRRRRRSTGGTAAGAEIPGYTTAGKTGTAEKAINGEYSKEFYVASFVGFAPANDPKLLAAVIVDEPEGDIYGGQVAAPAWKQIMNMALQYLKISP